MPLQSLDLNCLCKIAGKDVAAREHLESVLDTLHEVMSDVNTKLTSVSRSLHSLIFEFFLKEGTENAGRML